MKSELALQMLASLIWTSVIVVGPVLLVTMVVGLAISLLQAVTQVQEASLIFVPKILAVVITLVVLGPWMLRKVVGYSAALFGGLTVN